MNRRNAQTEPEFATAEEAEAYDRWFRAKVQAGIDDPRPPIPHEQAMAEIRALLAAKQKKRDASGKKS